MLVLLCLRVKLLLFNQSLRDSPLLSEQEDPQDGWYALASVRMIKGLGMADSNASRLGRRSTREKSGGRYREQRVIVRVGKIICAVVISSGVLNTIGINGIFCWINIRTPPPSLLVQSLRRGGQW